MAKRDKKDFGLNSKLDEIERNIFRIKVAYEKYFNGIERFEPLKDSVHWLRIPSLTIIGTRSERIPIVARSALSQPTSPHQVD